MSTVKAKYNKKPVILIDEYDKPLHPFLGTRKKLVGYYEDELASRVIRGELSELYGVLKDHGRQYRVFIDDRSIKISKDKCIFQIK